MSFISPSRGSTSCLALRCRSSEGAAASVCRSSAARGRTTRRSRQAQSFRRCSLTFPLLRSLNLLRRMTLLQEIFSS